MIVADPERVLFKSAITIGSLMVIMAVVSLVELVSSFRLMLVWGVLPVVGFRAVDGL